MIKFDFLNFIFYDKLKWWIIKPQEELGQIIISLPDCVALGRSPGSDVSLQQLKLLLLLLLGCAVQGPTKEHFILKIKELPVDTQHDIVECIKQVTDDQDIVLTLDQSEQSSLKLYNHVRTLTTERDKLLSQWMSDLGQEVSVGGPTSSAIEVVESNHLAVELADWKARLRKQRQELEEKTEILAECREELEHANALVAKFKAENSDLLVESRRAKVYQDEMDAMRERVERVDRLEAETQRYRERLADAEFYKVRVDELREDNKVLLETREMLEAQLARARQRAEYVLELEGELLASKQSFNEILLERDAAKEKIQELLEENLQLQQVTKSVFQETSTIAASPDSDQEETNSGDNSLSEQLTNNAQARALKLELENKKLLSTIDSLKERSFHENANKLLELEKEKKKLLLKCDQLQENCDRLTQQNDELESLFKNAMQENRKLQDNIDTIKVVSERQVQDVQNERTKVTELEKNVESLTKEKQRIQILCDTIKKRADNAEKSLIQVSDQLQSVQGQTEQMKELEKLSNEKSEKVVVLEKENGTLLKDINKFKEMLEAKAVSLDNEMEKSKRQEKDIQKMTKEMENLRSQVEKLQEFEQKSQELSSQTSVYEETVATLQKDLITEKLNNDKCKNSLEKLSLNFELLDSDLNVIVKNMLNNSKIKKIISLELDKDGTDSVVCQQCKDNKQTEECGDRLNSQILNFQTLNEVLQAENAKLQVDISTLKSQVHSLQTQQTALQLANSQLVAEKDELSKQQKIQNTQHDTILLDQITMRSLHEQLTAEYELLKVEQESLKKLNRDLRSEIRTLKETNSCQKEKVLALEAEKELLKNGAKNLAVLRAEHSKLKDDFRNLFTASERLKVEYRNIQEELKNVRTESRTLRLGQTEMQGELNSTSDLVAGLHLENAKLQQKCDMLFEMNHSLDSDRRALMDHVSQLLTQYHSLLTHSLEDKQHYHLEEKLYTDKVNNLCRQKEKLEEKIMEHYRKLDNASCKKKGFGATLVRKVRKAGSDIINKVPSRNRRSWHEDVSRLTQSQFTLSGGESGGNDSDNSVDEMNTRSDSLKGSAQGRRRDEVTLRKTYRDGNLHRSSIAGDENFSREPESILSLGSVGSRRTVYLSEEEPNNVTPAVTNQNQPPLLVYNRISTVLGDLSRPGDQQNSVDANATKDSTVKKDVDNSKETAVWYEYGCV
ncbi:protein Daple isoform X2 [Zophobas morio]|uniref:protein Daple isoform X2 n=1 Tax=Zophobas morio TaxID=2755281 RepID=UPI0030831614